MSADPNARNLSRQASYGGAQRGLYPRRVPVKPKFAPAPVESSSVSYDEYGAYVPQGPPPPPLRSSGPPPVPAPLPVGRSANSPQGSNSSLSSPDEYGANIGHEGVVSPLIPPNVPIMRNQRMQRAISMDSTATALSDDYSSYNVGGAPPPHLPPRVAMTQSQGSAVGYQYDGSAGQIPSMTVSSAHNGADMDYEISPVHMAVPASSSSASASSSVGSAPSFGNSIAQAAAAASSSSSSSVPHGSTLSLGLNKKQSSLVYNSRERRLIQDIITLFIQEQPEVIDYVFQSLAKDDVEAFIGSTINLTFARSTTLQLLRHFVEEEFKRHANGDAEAGNTLFRENSIASKILKSYLRRIGRGFLNDLLGSIETEVCIREQKVSYEIDPALEPDDMERARNQELLIAKIEKFLTVITSHTMVDKMPPGIRIIAAYFDTFAKMYCPSMNADALIGGFLMLRYINPAIMTPDLSGLIPPGKQITPKARRNLLLITKVLQNMSNGIVFNKKEPYLMVLNQWLELNTPRLQRSFQEIVKAASSCSTNLVIDSDVCSATVGDMQVFHQVIFALQDGIMDCIQKPETKQLLKQKMDSLGTYARKITFASQLDSSEQAHVRAILTKYHEEPSYVCILDVKKGKQPSKFIFVVGNNRLFLLRKKAKVVTGSSLVKNEAHILMLVEIRLWGSRGITLIFRNFEIEGETDDPEEVVACIKRAFISNFSHFPREIMFRVTATPPATIPPEEDLGMFREEHSACGGFVRTYKALCDFYGAPVSDVICWDLKNLYADNHVFDFKHLFNEEATDVEFVPALHALRYNTHFTTIINDYFKFKAANTLQGLSSLFKCNTTLTSLSLPSPGFSDKTMVNLFDAILSNPSCHIVNFNLPDCDIDEKAATVLGNIVSRRPPGNGVKSLILDSSLHSIKAFQAFCKSAGDLSACQALSPPSQMKSSDPGSPSASSPGIVCGSQELEVLSLSRCKIGDEIGELTKCFNAIGTSLRSLNISGTGVAGARLNSFLISLTKGCKLLEDLDVSDLKFTSAEVITVSQLFLIPTCRISSINISGSLPSTAALLQFLALGKPGMSLTTILRNHSFASDYASLKQLCETMPKALSVTHLDLSDTDIGDDGVFYLAEGLTLNKNLRTLIINGSFRVDSKRPRAETVRALAKLIISDCPLQTLEMAGGPKATQQLGRAVIPFFQSLMHNTTLTALDISGHMFGVAGAKALSKVVQLNATLTKIKYDMNDIGLMGLSAIAEGVATNSSIEVFPLPVLDIASILMSDHSAEMSRKVQTVCENLQLAITTQQ